MDVFGATEYINWTLSHSPKSYALHRELLIDLRKALVNSELAYQDAKNEKEKK